MIARGRRVKGGSRSPLARAVWERRDELQSLLKAGGEAGVAGGGGPSEPGATRPHSALPRYARVNPLRGGVVAEAITALAAGSGIVGSGIKASEDPLVPGLLQLPPKANLHGHALVRSGALIPQDRASCLPALALSPPSGAVVIDSCAAPGNKTTQLAAMVGATGTVIAFERNAARANTLRSQVERAGAREIVGVVQGDFVKSPCEGRALEATWALCDPSCSGTCDQAAIRQQSGSNQAAISQQLASNQAAISQQPDSTPGSIRQHIE